MQSKNSSRFHLVCLMLLTTALFLVGSGLAQSGSTNNSFIVVTSSNQEGVGLHLQTAGGRCWASGSADHKVAVGILEGCIVEPGSIPSKAALVARVKPNSISFRLQGKSYSVSDPQTVQNARSLFDSLVTIESQQFDLRNKEWNLGEKQTDFGRQQRDVKVGIPDLSGEFQKVQAEAKRLSTDGGTQSELGDLQSDLADLQSRLADLQARAADAEAKLGDQQSDLGDQQSKLGDQQSATTCARAPRPHERKRVCGSSLRRPRAVPRRHPAALWCLRRVFEYQWP